MTNSTPYLHLQLVARLATLIIALFVPSAIIGQDETRSPARVDGGSPTVLTTGPIHEAMLLPSIAAVEETVRVAHKPPADQPQLPKPSRFAAELQWIEGYWQWHHSQFVWVPGIWRRAPEGHQWQPGKWKEAPDGAVRYPGYWYPSGNLPRIVRSAPPAESPDLRDRNWEPTAKMIGDDAVWVRGSWELNENGDYQWVAGYLAAKENAYLWQASRVVPVPGGFVVLGGYWDYPMPERGEAFAALPTPDASVSELIPIDLASVVLNTRGQWIYTRLAGSSRANHSERDSALLQPKALPRRLSRELVADGRAAIVGIVRKGDLTPHNIKVKLAGSAALIAESDEEGRFRFTDVPYGTYRIVAEGPVQNYSRFGATIVDVDHPEVRVEIENNADPAELARTRSQAQADQVLKSANSVVRVTIGAGDPAAWSARAAHAGLAIWANTAVKSLDNMQDRTGFEP